LADGEVDERPQVTLGSCAAHRGEGSREGVGPESPCSTARSIIRTLRPTRPQLAEPGLGLIRVS
jgi:hypothetical protein